LCLIRDCRVCSDGNQTRYNSCQADICATNSTKTNPKERRNLHAVDSCHSKHLGNEMADGLAFLGSKKTSFSPVWMETALKKLHKKAVDMDTNEPTQEFTPQQHKGWSGYRDILITAAESHGSRKTAHCGLAIQYRCVATNTEKTSCSG